MDYPSFCRDKTYPRQRADGGQVGKACSRGRILPVDLGPHYEQIRMDPVDIRPVERRRQLQHVDPVCHEADPNVGIPVEAEGEIRLPAALDVGTGADRLGETDGAIVQIDFAEPGSELPRAPAARAYRVEDFDLAPFRRLIDFLRIRDVSFRARFPGQIPGSIDVVAVEVDL